MEEVLQKVAQKKRFLLAVSIGLLIVGCGIYLDQRREDPGKKEEQETSCKEVPPLPNNSTKIVTKIIDGDTFLIEGGHSVRVLGIDADERGGTCYQEAKDYLENLIYKREVRLVQGREDKDRWCRYLRYVFLNEKNVGLTLVEAGLAVARANGIERELQQELAQAEKKARKENRGCHWRKYPPTPEQTSNTQDPVSFNWEKLTTDQTNLEIINACNAGSYLDKRVIAEGKIVDTYRSQTNTVFLNFGRAFPNNCFTAVIFKNDQAQFPSKPENTYLGETVRIQGTVKEYQGKPEIILEDPNQIEVGNQ